MATMVFSEKHEFYNQQFTHQIETDSYKKISRS